MLSKLMQLKIDPTLKDDLDFIAEYKGIPVSALIKLTLKEAARKAKMEIYTANGLTRDQELEVLARDQEATQDYQSGKLQAKSAEDIIKELNA